MQELSNYPRPQLAVFRHVSELKKLRGWFLTFSILNTLYNFYLVGFYVYVSLAYTVGSALDLVFAPALYSAILNLGFLLMPWVRLSRANRRSSWPGIYAAVMTALLSLASMGFVATWIGFYTANRSLQESNQAEI